MDKKRARRTGLERGDFALRWVRGERARCEAVALVAREPRVRLELVVLAVRRHVHLNREDVPACAQHHFGILPYVIAWVN